MNVRIQVSRASVVNVEEGLTTTSVVTLSLDRIETAHPSWAARLQGALVRWVVPCAHPATRYTGSNPLELTEYVFTVDVSTGVLKVVDYERW